MVFVIFILMRLFNSARLKLTLLYLLISILISGFFSVLIYRMVSQELEQGLYRGAVVQRAHELGIKVPRHLPRRLQDIDPRLRVENICPECDDILNAAKQAFLVRLGIVNIMIWIFSAGAGFFLAGRTLEPLEQSMEEQKRFVADASHELRTPLTSLKTAIEVALRGENPKLEEQQNVLKGSLEDLGQLENLTNKLLALSRYEKIGKELEFEKFDLKNLVESVGERIKTRAEEKGVELNFELEEVILEGSEESLKEMFTVFLDNAIKYTNSGGQVGVSVRKEKNQAIIQISDTGVGIAEKDLPHIFNRFYRADTSRTKQETPGFGLGLSVAKKVIEFHNGSVEVESALGKGTAFTIRLPL